MTSQHSPEPRGASRRCGTGHVLVTWCVHSITQNVNAAVIRRPPSAPIRACSIAGRAVGWYQCKVDDSWPQMRPSAGAALLLALAVLVLVSPALGGPQDESGVTLLRSEGDFNSFVQVQSCVAWLRGVRRAAYGERVAHARRREG